ncbi:DNA-binding CsgD family transcriptional regulator [Novosphingobium hassiacum]|uniref:DNA-binding CsgD family transcriptional regulator n=1 Tax=Novosphingobium hassiacum TaxID=173676 RepID=A0A7W5ZX93_9SPHN|nr:DUF4019 domain-containing protein [Novosphingobium hassiacum]MBB3859867.1 DNA-binding CsgD family transcriptional regulator [Novosphingobium hassiacum]
MHDDANQLSEREKETLRLLLSGHDAKSSARALGLSVHTINERLRDSRRKLGVSSSREAARILAEAEQATPKSLGYTQFGVGENEQAVTEAGQRIGRNERSVNVWIIGGLTAMLVTIAAVLLAQGAPVTAPPAPASPAPQTSSTPSPSVTAAAEASARTWLGLVDAGNWDKSWNGAATMFRTQVTTAKWASMIEPVRKPLGALATRALKDAKQTSVLPGAPEGDYILMQFSTGFANAPATTETVILAREATGWKVAGYFIRPV